MSSSSTSSPAAKRLLAELRQLSTPNNPPPPFILQIGPNSDAEATHWSAVMKGATGSAYEQGVWKLDIRVPEGYPMKPPEISFVTRCCHPNVGWKTGEICLDLLKDAWSPANTILSTLSAIHQMLAYPEPDSPLNVDIAVLMRNGDLIGAEGLIRWCCAEWRWDGR